MKKCCFNRNSPMVVVALTVQVPTPSQSCYTSGCTQQCVLPCLIYSLEKERSRDLQILAAMGRGRTLPGQRDYHFFFL